MTTSVDRLATLYFFHPAQRIISRFSVELQIPILMYHSISNDPEPRSHPYYATTTSPEVFDEHLQYLHSHKYVSLTLAEAAVILKSGHPISGNHVVITFDDGFRDFYEVAFPSLQKYGLTGTMFLPTGFIGNSAKNFKGKPCLTWSEVKELHRGGIEFGSHTVSHPKLVEMDAEKLRYELQASKVDIESRLGGTVGSFAYPFAFPETRRSFTSKLRDMLEEAGYQQGVTTSVGIAGAANHNLFLKRLPANSYDDIAFFRAKLEGGYDWLHRVQYISKTIKPRRG